MGKRAPRLIRGVWGGGAKAAVIDDSVDLGLGVGKPIPIEVRVGVRTGVWGSCVFRRTYPPP